VGRPGATSASKRLSRTSRPAGSEMSSWPGTIALECGAEPFAVRGSRHRLWCRAPHSRSAPARSPRIR
jgi:hypothetical protein